MSTVLDAADFRGVSRSVTAVHGTSGWPKCSACESTLYGRREGTRRRNGTVLEVFRCRCGVGRHVEREVAAA
jgi:hypothetical protein